MHRIATVIAVALIALTAQAADQRFENAGWVTTCKPGRLTDKIDCSIERVFKQIKGGRAIQALLGWGRSA